jgi:pectinesterase
MLRLALAAFLIALPLHAADVHVRVDPSAPPATPGNENLTVFPTIQNALDHHPFATPNPDGTPGRVFIEIAPGTYHERLIVTQNHPNITLLGMGKAPEDVVITNSLNAKQAGGTFLTATVEIDGPGQITAQSRTSPDQTTGFVILNSRVTSGQQQTGAPDGVPGERPLLAGVARLDSETWVPATSSSTLPGAKSASSAHNTIGLGRPWRPYARVVYIHTELPADLNPAGWNNWSNPANEATAYFAESDSTGPGASPSTRVPWSRQLSAAEARQYLPQTFLAGSDHWNPIAAAAQVP